MGTARIELTQTS
jgi:hypothetical protein